MHLEPYIDNTLGNIPEGEGRQISNDDHDRYATNWDQLPWWLNRYLVDNPQNDAVLNGGLIFPNERIELSDVVGWQRHCSA